MILKITIFVTFITLPNHLWCFMLKLLECAKYDAEFTVVFPNAIIDRGQVKNITQHDLKECLRLCTIHPICRSVNFHRTNGICQMLSHHFVNPKDYLQSSAGWYHYRTKEKKNLGHKCLKTNPCQPQQRCEDTCEPPYHHCVNIDADNITIPYHNSEQSTDLDSIYYADIALDRIYARNHPYCSHTNDRQSWWQVIYQYKILVHKVHVYNRMDCCSDRLSNAVIEVFDNNRNVQRCGVTGDMLNVWHKEIICEQILTGTGVRIYQTSTNSLSLCEVDIIGAIYTN